ncbi:hypothetical protein MNBD_GAMMA09-1171 [hydrothermal vent metagenome]|uniref:DUF1493 family protein n=1 Tax=hydrothermal vent metagenome TaxID=652676 RepID=A0A3B0Y5Z7_9ZZZZ
MLTEVINIVSEQSGTPIEKLNGATLIEEDLGLTGDDAWEVIEELEKKYNIDFTEFDFLKHFGPEAGWASSKEYGYYPVSIDHLVKVVKNKKWLMPERNENNYIKQKSIRKRNRIKIVLLMCIIFTVYLLVKKYA